MPLVGARSQRSGCLRGAPEKNAAEALTRHALGNLHCTILARVELTSRALASFELAEGGVQEWTGTSVRPTREALPRGAVGRSLGELVAVGALRTYAGGRRSAAVRGWARWSVIRCGYAHFNIVCDRSAVRCTRPLLRLAGAANRLAARTCRERGGCLLACGNASIVYDGLPRYRSYLSCLEGGSLGVVGRVDAMTLPIASPFGPTEACS